VVLLATLAACGSVKSSADAGGGDDDALVDSDFTLDVSSAALTIPIASSATVTVQIERTGTPGDVMLSASGAGANLTVEFSPNPIPAGATSATATIRAKGGMAAASSTLTITGTGGDKTHSASVAVTTTTITVTGKVRGGLANVTVGLVGKPSVTTGAGGTFTFTDVTPPYDLYTVSPTGCTTPAPMVVHYFDELTRNDPTVIAAPPPTNCIYQVVCGGVFPCNFATVTGTRSGAGNGTDPIVFAYTAGAINVTATSASSYSASVPLGTSDSSSGTVYALQLTRKPTGAPDAYLGFAKSGTVTLNKNTATTVNLNAAAVTSTFTLSGTITSPAGYGAPDISLNQEFGTTSQALWETNDTTTVDATVPVIAAAGGTNLYVSANLGSAYSYYTHPLSGDTTVNFSMIPAAELVAPAAGATGVTNATQFTWTAAPGTISRVAFFSDEIGGSTYYVYTAASETTIPMVDGAPLPSGKSFSWRVSGYGPNASVDEAAATNELEDASAVDFQGPPHAYTSSESRSFTTP
jgi:hypothetical protein